MKTRSLSFIPFSSEREGLVLDLLRESYAPLLQTLPARKVAELLRSWTEYDRSITDEPDTVGAAGFLSKLGQEIVGFSSWDPRGFPDLARIGHNCIRPRFQGRGIGTLQIVECLSLLKRMGFERTEARTDEHPFFRPAVRVYRKCGFEITASGPGTLTAETKMICLALELNSRA